MTDKPTLYLLPGLLCDEAVWQAQKDALASRADVRIPLFRGFDSLTAMARSVLDTAPARFSVVGHSMGGRVAMELMRLAGDRIERFALMDTGAHGVRPGEAEKRQVLLELADREGLMAVAGEWILPMVHPSRHRDKALIDAITEMIMRNRVEDYKGQVRALLGREDQSLYLPQIRQHVLLACGEADTWSPVSQHEEMMALLPSAELKVIPEAGHMAPMEKPDQVNRMLADWLAD